MEVPLDVDLELVKIGWKPINFNNKKSTQIKVGFLI
jgi:hypothetical protein